MSTYAIRRGMQLLELLISLTSASVLMVGIGSSIFIASESMNVATSRQSSSSLTQTGMDRLRADLAEAFPLQARTENSVTLAVRDRTGDGVRESIQYRWLGSAGAPLQMSINSGSWLNVTEGLDFFEMNWHTRACIPKSFNGGFDRTGTLAFQSSTSASGAVGTSLTIPLPATYRAGDLLVAAVAVAGNATSATGPSSWQAGPRQLNKKDATLVTYYSLAPSGGSITISWSGGKASYGVIAHFATPAGTATLTNFSGLSDSGNNPVAPGATALAENSLVIRLVAAECLLVKEDACNMPGHIGIALKRNLLTNPLVGMAFRYYGMGNVPASVFNIGTPAEYATATLVFQP